MTASIFCIQTGFCSTMHLIGEFQPACSQCSAHMWALRARVEAMENTCLKCLVFFSRKNISSAVQTYTEIVLGGLLLSRRSAALMLDPVQFYRSIKGLSREFESG